MNSQWGKMSMRRRDAFNDSAPGGPFIWPPGACDTVFHVLVLYHLVVACSDATDLGHPKRNIVEYQATFNSATKADLHDVQIAVYHPDHPEFPKGSVERPGDDPWDVC
jgi:hypothetical protein